MTAKDNFSNPPPGPARATQTPNSALVWFPLIQTLNLGPVGVPKTIIVPYNHQAAVEAMKEVDGPVSKLCESVRIREWIDAITQACQEIGFPCFIRTDVASAKHDGPVAYLARGPEDVRTCFWRTVEDNEWKIWYGLDEPSAIMVREWLDLRHDFTAFGGHPIAREWRFFVQNRFVETPPELEILGYGPSKRMHASIRCCHFYWPEDAIQRPSRKDWQEVLYQTSVPLVPGSAEYCLIGCSAIRAAEACQEHGEGWSVDFAQDVRGKWWLIDMALSQCGVRHPATCRQG